MVENDHDKKNNTGAVTVGFTTAHLSKEFAHSSGLVAAGFVVEKTVKQQHKETQDAQADYANLTGAGEFAARGSINVASAKLEAEKKKKDSEKVLLQSALEQQIIALQNDINDLLDKRNALLEQKGTISKALNAMDDGARPEDIAKNPKMENSVKKYEKIHGKKPSNDDPTSFYKFLKGEEREVGQSIKGIDIKLKSKLKELQELDPANDNVQKVKSILNDLDSEEADIIAHRFQSKEDRASAYEVIGGNTADAEFLASIDDIKSNEQKITNGSFAKSLDEGNATSSFKDEFQRAATTEVVDTVSHETKNVPVPDFAM